MRYSKRFATHHGLPLGRGCTIADMLKGGRKGRVSRLVGYMRGRVGRPGGKIRQGLMMGSRKKQLASTAGWRRTFCTQEPAVRSEMMRLRAGRFVCVRLCLSGREPPPTSQGSCLLWLCVAGCIQYSKMREPDERAGVGEEQLQGHVVRPTVLSWLSQWARRVGRLGGGRE